MATTVQRITAALMRSYQPKEHSTLTSSRLWAVHTIELFGCTHNAWSVLRAAEQAAPTTTQDILGLARMAVGDVLDTNDALRQEAMNAPRAQPATIHPFEACEDGTCKLCGGAA